MTSSYITYPTAFSNDAIANTVSAIEKATVNVKRDLLIVALMVLLLGLSDGTIIKDESRFRKAIEDLSHQVCFIVSGTADIDPKDMN